MKSQLFYEKNGMEITETFIFVRFDQFLYRFFHSKALISLYFLRKTILFGLPKAGNLIKIKVSAVFIPVLLLLPLLLLLLLFLKTSTGTAVSQLPNV